MAKSRLVLFVACWLTATVSSGIAQEHYPDRPIRLVVAAPAGGGTDIIARVFGRQLESQLGQPVVVDNMSGGSGVLAANHVARAKPDGYTLLVTFDGHTISAASNKSLKYDPVKSFTPVTQLTSSAILLTVNTASPPNDLKSFLDWVKSYKGPLNAGVPGEMSPGSAAAKALVRRAGLDAALINNQGTGKTLWGVLSGEYQFAMTSLGGTVGTVKSGQLRAIGISSSRRSAILPDVAPISDTFPGYKFESWYGLMGPAGLPDPIAKKLALEARKALAAPAVSEALEKEGSNPVGSSPEEFTAMLQDDLANWSKFFGTVN